MAHQLLSEADRRLLDSNAIITRDRAIRNGGTFEFNAFGSAVAARVRVTSSQIRKLTDSTTIVRLVSAQRSPLPGSAKDSD